MPRTKSKRNISVFKTVFDGLKAYLYNLDIYAKYLSFPILGTVFGMFFLFFINYFFVTHLEQIEKISPVFENEAVILTLLLIIVIPAFLIMIKALIDYIIAYGAINSMCVLGTKRIEDVYSHKETVKRRFAPYCILILVLSVIFGVLSVPFLWPLLIVALIFLSLSIQIFSLEENLTPFESIRKSIELVKSNFWVVFWALIFITLISYVAVPYLISWAVAKTPLFQWLAYPVEKYLSLMPVSDINSFLASANISYSFDVIIIAENIVNCVISTIVIMYMLPFRCACCVEMYKGLNENYFSEIKQEEKSKNKEKTKKYKKKTD